MSLSIKSQEGAREGFWRFTVEVVLWGGGGAWAKVHQLVSLDSLQPSLGTTVKLVGTTVIYSLGVAHLGGVWDCFGGPVGMLFHGHTQLQQHKNQTQNTPHTSAGW